MAMTDLEVRLACLRLAVDTQGSPDKIKTARDYYGWIADGATEAPTVEAPKLPKRQLTK